MLTALIAVAVAQISAKDFFPLNPGTRWTYEISGEGAGTYVQEVGFPVEVGGQERCPILIKSGSKITQTTFYDVSDAGVYVLGHNAKKLLEKPQPVFQVGEKETKWAFEGASPYEDDTAARIFIKGQSKVVGLRDVLGTKRLCLEVKSDVRIGITEETSTKIQQTSLYAQSVGLVQFEDTKSLGRRIVKTKVKLLKYDAPEGGA